MLLKTNRDISGNYSTLCLYTFGERREIQTARDVTNTGCSPTKKRAVNTILLPCYSCTAALGEEPPSLQQLRNRTHAPYCSQVSFLCADVWSRAPSRTWHQPFPFKGTEDARCHLLIECGTGAESLTDTTTDLLERPPSIRTTAKGAARS